MTCLSRWERPRAARVRVGYEDGRSCSYATLTPALSEGERGTFSLYGRRPSRRAATSWSRAGVEAPLLCSRLNQYFSDVRGFQGTVE